MHVYDATNRDKSRIPYESMYIKYTKERIPSSVLDFSFTEIVILYMCVYVLALRYVSKWKISRTLEKKYKSKITVLCPLKKLLTYRHTLNVQIILFNKTNIWNKRN